MPEKIFGYDWEQIKDAQQGVRLNKPIPAVSPETQRNRILADIAKFSIPVSQDVATALEIPMPENYTLGADNVWRVAE